jgi:hypothetical protein
MRLHDTLERNNVATVQLCVVEQWHAVGVLRWAGRVNVPSRPKDAGGVLPVGGQGTVYVPCGPEDASGVSHMAGQGIIPCGPGDAGGVLQMAGQGISTMWPWIA